MNPGVANSTIGSYQTAHSSPACNTLKGAHYIRSQVQNQHLQTVKKEKVFLFSKS